jgi:hypothetical protein
MHQWAMSAEAYPESKHGLAGPTALLCESIKVPE